VLCNVWRRVRCDKSQQETASPARSYALGRRLFLDLGRWCRIRAQNTCRTVCLEGSGNGNTVRAHVQLTVRRRDLLVHDDIGCAGERRGGHEQHETPCARAMSAIEQQSSYASGPSARS